MNLAAIFLKVLNMSFVGAVIVFIVLWVRLLYHMLPKKYLCILWSVVLIRLLCPFTFPTLTIGEPIQEPIPRNIMELQQPYIASEIEVIDNTVNYVLEQNFTPKVEESVNPMQVAMVIGTFLWLGGIAVMLIYTAWKLFHFYKWINEAIPDKGLGNRIYRCAVETPVVTGVFRPRIYLPYALQEPQLTHVLAHEKMHILRKDYLLKLLFYIAVIVHWFNPFVWIAYRLLERDMEMACDEAVLEKLGIEEKMKYCESLLELASSKNHFVGNPVAFGESDVKKRIKNLLNYEKPVFWLSVIAVAVIIYTAVRCLNGPQAGELDQTNNLTEMTNVEYPQTKEKVEDVPNINVSENSTGNYVIHIEDEGYGPKMPICMDISFLPDENENIVQDSKDVKYETGTDAKYSSVSVYLNDETQNIKYVWLTIHNVEIYSDRGEFLMNAKFDYELMFRIDTETLKIYDLKKNGDNIVTF